MVKRQKKHENKDEYFSTDVELNPSRPGRPARVFSSEEERRMFVQQRKKEINRRYTDKMMDEASQGQAERYTAFKNCKQQQKARRYGNRLLVRQPTAAALLLLEQITTKCAKAH
jgi:hypothetical protein